MTRKQRRATFIALSVAVLSAAVLLVLLPCATPSSSSTRRRRWRRSRSRPASASASAASSPRAASSAAPAPHVEFAITDTVKTIPVSYTGLLPDLFREGQGVVAEGKLDPAGRFLADTVLAKHDENYMPPEVAKALKEQGVWKHAEPKDGAKK